MEQHERLRQYNRWRRGDKRLKAPNPKELGELIDGVADRLEVLEREHSEFFDRWHGERRKREKLAADVERCYRMLLSEQDTKGALFKAENILREALAEQKVCAGRTAHEGHNDKAQGAGGGLIAGGSPGATGSTALEET